MRINPRVAVVQSDRKPYVNDAVAHSIDPRAAEGVRIQRPAQRMNDRTRGKAMIRHLPEFFDAYGIDLRVARAIKLQTIDQLFSQRAGRAFAEHSNFCNNINARLKIRLGLSGLVNPLVACANACDAVSV